MNIILVLFIVYLLKRYHENIRDFIYDIIDYYKKS